MTATGFKFSIVCPALNEGKYIGDIIEAFVQYCPQPSELFIADGGSTDNTKAIVLEWTKRYENIFLINNERKFVSYAFNQCYPKAKGKYLALLGAHTHYPATFFNIALKELESGNADVVGGPLKQIGSGNWGSAIAACMSTPFGVGGTEFRVLKKRMYVDSVAFACYNRKVFEKIGLFDEKLIRNQDDEMHYRINAHGFRILMVPEMDCSYQVRSTIGQLFKQYFQYGLYKPLVLKKVSSGIRLRHLIPALFCIYLLVVPLIIWGKANLLLVPLILYGILLFWFSFTRSLSFDRVRALIVYPTLHVSYGLGFILGLFKLK